MPGSGTQKAQKSLKKVGVTTKPTPRFPRVSIRLDVIDPVGFLRYKLPYACEDCSHFDSRAASCTLGYLSTPHRREEQNRSYILRGKMALCRFLEID